MRSTATAATGDEAAQPGNRPGRAPRVLVLGSSMGAGHMTAARMLEQRVEARGGEARVLDFLELPPFGQGDAVRVFYRAMINRTPWAYDRIMKLWAGHRGFFERVTSVGEGGYVRAFCREVERFRPDVVVSTYNLAGQMLGRLREEGRLSARAVAYVTDAGAHPYWVAPGADLHLVPLDVTARDLRAQGADRVHVVSPLVDVPQTTTSKRAARRWLGLPDYERVVLVNGGSWGVGDVVGAARALHGDRTLTLVMCGHSTELAQRLAGIPDCWPIRWTEHVEIYLAAADVVVDNAGGTTTWEAMVVGRPVVLFRPLAGHGRLNAAALVQAGLATVATTPQELRAAAADPPTAPAPQRLLGADDAADVVLDLAREALTSPIPERAAANQ